ncbi:methyl-accepting chemotaxis protein [Sphingomonas sp. XXL09]|uniref:methyl-accepting chemotaxis protein n=1 Tax=Sphingomonas sp. XXL09 TaxID=3457787 RepID=UPI00406BD9EF
MRIQQVNDLQAEILPPPAYIIEPYLVATLLIQQPETLAARRVELGRLEAAYRGSVARWRAASLDPRLANLLFRGVVPSADRFWRELRLEMLPAIERGDRVAAQASYARLTTAYQRHRQGVDRLAAAAGAAHGMIMANTHATLRTMIGMLLALGVLVTALLVAAVAYVIGKVLRPIGETAVAMQTMAAGNLRLTLVGSDRQDEIGAMVKATEVFRAAARAQVDHGTAQKAVVSALATALQRLGEGDVTHRVGDGLPQEYHDLARSFDTAMEQLSDTLRRVEASAVAVRTSAGEVNIAAGDLSQRTEQQAASLEQTAATMDEITGAVRETASGANRVSEIMRLAREETERSGLVVRQATEAMAAIERSAQQISQIIGVIDAIAFQTNLLALNAGVEAARAGDAGRGFAVVASEVRALAGRSADAAKEVKQLIGASSQQVGVGVDLVGETGRALAALVMRVAEVTDLTAEIAASAERQSTSLQQINIAVAEMDGTTQENAAMVEEATAAATHLAGEAERLTQEVGRFRLDTRPRPSGLPIATSPEQRPPAGRRRVALRAV